VPGVGVVTLVVLSRPFRPVSVWRLGVSS
jgi:hypothetical protein